MDISQNAIENCKNNGIKNAFVMDAQKILLPQKFHAIIASDCLEHLENDDDAIKCWYNLLKINGILIVFVPAFMFLWSNHDAMNMHFRRYNMRELRAKLRKNGFEIVKASYWNFFLFFPYSISLMLLKLFRKNGKNNAKNNLQRTTIFNKILYYVLNLENRMLCCMSLPVVVSVFCIAKKS